MYQGIFIDAHLLGDISDAIASESGPLYDMICWILDNCGIAITPLIQTHWEEKISDNERHFWEWYYLEYHVNRRIHEIPLIRLDAQLMNKVKINCHLPNDIYVKGYIKGANSTKAPRYILAEDMDFYDPRYKQAESRTKNKIIASRSGKLCEFLERTLHIRVGSLDDCNNYFSTSTGPCPTAVSANCFSCQHIP